MPPLWIAISELTIPQTRNSRVAWADIQVELRNRKIQSRAAVVEEWTLEVTRFDLSDMYEGEEIFNVGQPEISIRLRRDLLSLAEGNHQLKLSGEHLSVQRRGHNAVIYHAGEHIRTSESLPDEFWDTAIVDQDASVVIADDLRSRRRTQAFGIVVRRSDLVRIWPAAADSPVRGRGGAPRQWDWEGAFIEMARIFIFERSPPRTNDEWKARVRSWFETYHPPVKNRRHPSDTELLPRIRQFREMLRQGDEG
jgi:hypothetical protein